MCFYQNVVCKSDDDGLTKYLPRGLVQLFRCAEQGVGDRAWLGTVTTQGLHFLPLLFSVSLCNAVLQRPPETLGIPDESACRTFRFHPFIMYFKYPLLVLSSYCFLSSSSIFFDLTLG